MRLDEAIGSHGPTIVDVEKWDEEEEGSAENYEACAGCGGSMTDLEETVWINDISDLCFATFCVELRRARGGRLLWELEDEESDEATARRAELERQLQI